MPKLREWSPMRELSDLEERLESMFSQMPRLRGFGNGGEQLRSTRWTPRVDIYQDEDQLVVECECPGMNRDEIDVSIDDSTLTISGERHREKEIDENDYFRSERHFEKFQRSFRLPQEINADAVEAHYEDGILKVQLPVMESKKKHKVEID